MKLALIGGGGVRAPEFTRGALAFAAALDLQELWLMDTNGEKLQVIAGLCQEIVRGSQLQVHATTHLDDALRDCGAIVTTIRVGGERGRVLDERIALKHGVLGQETTGAGGFAMAMRSIPAILNIAQRAAELCPGAYLFNFTNPAGLVVQALADAGFSRAIGICDSANGAQHAVARWAGVPREAVRAEVYGLNHLSWARAALLEERDILPDALLDDEFLRTTHLNLFAPEWVRHKRSFLNEYLYYWYYRDIALREIAARPATRGEEVEALNRTLYTTLAQHTLKDALAAYDTYQARRSSTYMSSGETTQQAPLRDVLSEEEAVDGYAGVALKTLLALHDKETQLHIALNVRNGNAIPTLQQDDVVEVSCSVSKRGIEPVSIGEVPEDDALLMQNVKRYERLTSTAIRSRNRSLAIDALIAHPLVASYPTARLLLDDYLEAHEPYVGSWR